MLFPSIHTRKANRNRKTGKYEEKKISVILNLAEGTLKLFSIKSLLSNVNIAVRVVDAAVFDVVASKIQVELAEVENAVIPDVKKSVVKLVEPKTVSTN